MHPWEGLPSLQELPDPKHARQEWATGWIRYQLHHGGTQEGCGAGRRARRHLKCLNLLSLLSNNMLLFCKLSLNLTFIVSFLDFQTQNWTRLTRHSLFFTWVVEILKYLHNRRRLPGYFRSWRGRRVPCLSRIQGHPDPMTTSLVNKAVKSIWKTAGVNEKLSVTDLRKATATKVRLHFYIKIILNTSINAFFIQIDKGLDCLTWVYGDSVLYIDNIIGSRYKQYFYFHVRSKFPWARDANTQQMTHRAATQDQYYLLKQSKCDILKVV